MPVLFAAVFFGLLALALAVHDIMARRHRRVLDLLVRMEERRFLQAHGERVAAALRREGAGLMRRLLEQVAPLARGTTGSDTAARLRWAGVTLSVEQYAALRLMLAAVAALVGALLGGAVLGLAGALPGGILASTLGYMAAGAWVTARLARRRGVIDQELLYFLDLLALTAQAGLSLDNALTQVAAEFPGILSAAFIGMQRQRGLGQWSEHALADVAAQVGHRDVQLLCEALGRAGRFGSRTAAALRELSGTVRRRRHLAAQEQANRAGAAIVLPVALFIMPSILIILGYPAVTMVVGALAAR